jgi:hypothetical protein
MRILVLVLLCCLVSCQPQNQIKPNTEMPRKMIWAWERPEDLRFLDPKEFGVAFLAQTLFLEKDRVDQKARRQPLELAEGAYVIAVTRIESKSDGFSRSSAFRMPEGVTLTGNIVDLVKRTLQLPNVKGIQIDFDAVVSERGFYRELIGEIRKGTPEGVTLTMTSLASWCTGDAWFNDFPVDEAVPMAFVMGADTEKVRNYLRNGNDWQEPLCGISVDEPKLENLKPERRIFYFKNTSWSKTDLERF